MAPNDSKQNPCLLIVDDSAAMHRLLGVKLKDESVELISAYSGEESLELAESMQPGLVLLDVIMPGMNGLDALRSLKANPATMNIPVIMLSGQDDAETKVRSFELGAMDYVTKPFEVSELRARVGSALRITRLMELLEQRAQIDGLTGLGNRSYFNARLEQEVTEAARKGHPLSLVICDLDHFKRLNDTFGHPAGDEVLQSFAKLIQDQIRAYDVACRYGGEEFALILPQTTELEAVGVCSRIREAIEAKTWARYPDMRATCSFGVATEPLGETREAGRWVEAADKALYAAKEAGRNRVHIYAGLEGGQEMFRAAA